MNSRNLAVPSVNENVENNSKSATTISLNFSLVLFNMKKKAAAYIKSGSEVNNVSSISN